MDTEYQTVNEEVLFAKSTVIMDTITRLQPLQFAVSMLLALRQTLQQQSTCTDGCGRLFSKCPRWEDDPEGLNWVKEVVEKYKQPTVPNICGTCFLPRHPKSEIHPESSIAIRHTHTNVEGTPDTPTKVDIFGPGLLLLKRKPIQAAMGIQDVMDSITADQAIEFLKSKDPNRPSSHLQTLFLLSYHLLPTTAHSPDAPATLLHAAANNHDISLPTRISNNIHLDRLFVSAVNAAVAAVNQIESLKPVGGHLVQHEYYGDGTVAKVIIEWDRTQPKEQADIRAIFSAHCHAVIRYIDKMSEDDARVLFRVIAREQENNFWGCPCGSDTFFSSCTRCTNTHENRKATIRWTNGILHTLIGHITEGDHSTGSQCFGCLLPQLPNNCPADLALILAHNRDLKDETCAKELPELLSPAIALLYRTAVRKVLDFPDDVLHDCFQVSKWLATPWPAIPYLSTIHRLYFLHYFLLPTTRHSPLAGGFRVMDADIKGNKQVVPYRGPSEANITYVKEVEDEIMYAAVESVRPKVNGTRTVERSALDGSLQTEVTHLVV